MGKGVGTGQTLWGPQLWRERLTQCGHCQGNSGHITASKEPQPHGEQAGKQCGWGGAFRHSDWYLPRLEGQAQPVIVTLSVEDPALGLPEERYGPKGSFPANTQVGGCPGLGHSSASAGHGKDNACVPYNQMSDTLSLVAELEEEGERRRSARE